MDLDCGRVAPLDDDVLAEILVRLPVQSLMRFQSVSKSWRSLISADNLRRLHALHRLLQPQSLVLVTRFWPDPLITKEKTVFSIFNPIIKPTDKKLIIKPFDFLQFNNSEILSSSNGLVLLRFQHDCDGYHVYNPFTKKSRILGFPYREDESYTHIVSIHIVFDPSDSLHYKIVCIRAEDEPPKPRMHARVQPRMQARVQPYLIEVFASERRKWRVCVEPFVSGERMDFSDCVQCDNLVYLVHKEPNDGPICCFDIVKNASNLIEIPEPNTKRRRYSHLLQESNGCVYYCALLGDYDKLSAALWELQVKGDNDFRRSEWLLKYEDGVCGLPSGSKLLRFIAETSTVLIHVPERGRRREWMEMEMEIEKAKIVSYNFVDTSLKNLLNLDTQAYEYFFQSRPTKAYANVYEFGETLALP